MSNNKQFQEEETNISNNQIDNELENGEIDLRIKYKLPDITQHNNEINPEVIQLEEKNNVTSNPIENKIFNTNNLEKKSSFFENEDDFDFVIKFKFDENSNFHEKINIRQSSVSNNQRMYNRNYRNRKKSASKDPKVI